MRDTDVTRRTCLGVNGRDYHCKYIFIPVFLYQIGTFVTGTLTMATIGVRSIPLYDEAEPAAAAKNVHVYHYSWKGQKVH